MVTDINMLPRGPKESFDRMSGIDRLAVGAFFAIALLIGIDLVNDSREGAAISHLLVELLAAITALSTGAFLVRHMSASYRKERAQLELRLAEVREESRKWREQASRHIHGLGAAIDAQFEAWGLSEAEKDVALLLLKGLSHKEIAMSK